MSVRSTNKISLILWVIASVITFIILLNLTYVYRHEWAIWDKWPSYAKLLFFYVYSFILVSGFLFFIRGFNLKYMFSRTNILLILFNICSLGWMFFSH